MSQHQIKHKAEHRYKIEQKKPRPYSCGISSLAFLPKKYNTTHAMTNITNITSKTMDNVLTGKPPVFCLILFDIVPFFIAAIIALIFLTKKAEKKQAEQQAQLEAASQTMTMLIIDKGRLPLKEAGLPEMVINNTPKYLRRSKVPVVTRVYQE